MPLQTVAANMFCNAINKLTSYETTQEHNNAN